MYVLIIKYNLSISLKSSYNIFAAQIYFIIMIVFSINYFLLVKKNIRNANIIEL